MAAARRRRRGAVRFDPREIERVATTQMRPLIDAVRAFLNGRSVDCDAIPVPWEP